MEKKYKCQLCGWNGQYTHLHHIIPLSNYGDDCDENLIELCPNCHSETFNHEATFAKKHNLKGKLMNKEKRESLEKASLLWHKMLEEGTYKPAFDLLTLINIMRQYHFDEIDFMAYLIGIDRSRVIKKYIRG